MRFFFMNMQDQTRKAFGHYAKRQTARAKAGDLGSPFINSELHPSLRKQVDGYVQPPQADDISFTDMLAGQDKDNLHIDVSGHGSPDVIIARPDVAKELGSMFVNGFGDAAKVVSSDDVGYDYQLPPTEVGGLFLSSVVKRLKADSLPKDSVLRPYTFHTLT